MTRVLALLTAGVLAGSLAAQAPTMIKQGNVLSWSTSAGQKGALRIVALDHLYFEAEQTNERNQGAGTIHMYGAILDGGRRIVLVQPGDWKCVWDGNVVGNEIAGKLQQGSGSYTFRIGGAAAPAPMIVVSTAPFLNGKTLKWSTDAGQNGTMRVTSVTGSTFLLDQTNVKNLGAGIIKLDGEIKDGRVYIYNRKWNEIWTGTAVNGVVTGKVNRGGAFRITE